MSLTRDLVRLARARTPDAADFAHAERFGRDWIGSRVAGGAAPVGRILSGYRGGHRSLDRQVFLAAALSPVPALPRVGVGVPAPAAAR